MRLKHLALVTSLCIVGTAARASYADTLKLVSTTGSTVTINNPEGSGTVSTNVYPYNFYVNGSSTLTSLMCITLADKVTLGEPAWNVSEQTLTPTSNTAYLEDAWLFSNLGQDGYTNTEIQFAVWDVLDSSSVKTDSEYKNDPVVQSLVNQAFTEATTSGDLSAEFLSQFTIYTPTSIPSGYTTPQTFIGETPLPTPEPSSLLLLATGLMGAGSMVMRRRTKTLITETLN